MASQLSLGRREWLLLLGLSVLWGGSFFFAKLALTELPPLTLVWLRVTLAALALAAYLRITGHSLGASASLWRTYASMGLLNNLIPFSLLFYGQTQIGAGLASVFNALVPLFTVLVAHVSTQDEKLSTSKLVGVGIGALGVVLLFQIDTEPGDGALTHIAMLACLMAAMSYAFASVYGRRFAALGVAPARVAFGQVTATATLMLPIVLTVDQPWQLAPPSTTTWAAVGGLALGSTALAYVLFFRILAASGAVSISLVTFLVPISAITLGVLFLDETFSGQHAIGAALIFAGLFWINDGIRRARRASHTDTAPVRTNATLCTGKR